MHNVAELLRHYGALRAGELLADFIADAPHDYRR